MAPFCEGDLVFVPSADAFDSARVQSVDRSGQFAEVKLEKTGATQRLNIAELRQRFCRDDGATAQDNTALVHMNDATILENLHTRHTRDEIYTYTASVLLAMNPYKDIRGLYGDEQCGRYKGKHIGALPPHPYAIADTAYRALVREKRNQGLLISGESGAGKTETAKIVMQFLAYTSGTVSDHADNIQARVLRAQPILESFGNAVTMRNNNSSRFGKYNRVFFDYSGALVDAGITTYLLESSRVVTHGQKERTYHCFYELLRGLDDEKLQELQLDREHKYRLLTNGGGEQLPGFEKRDAQNFHRMVDALKTMGFDEGDVDNMMRILAGLIHLGDVERAASSDDEDESAPIEVDDEIADRAARLLGLDPVELCGRLTRKKVAVPGRSSFHEVPRTASQFKHTKQSFIKAVYKRLFDRVVARINDSFKDLRPANFRQFRDEAWAHIGILDIYGFENLMKNSFEQLCINLANERLQQYFVENVLLAEQDLYKREALPWIGLAVPDAQPVFTAIDKIFKTLDEYSQNLTRNVGNATDKNFCQKILDEASKDPVRRDVLKQIKMSANGRKSISAMCLNEGFLIKHYAGQVQYATEGWLDKNNDRLLPECEDLICESTNPLVRALGEEDNQNSKGQLFRSISKKYTKDLENLLETLSTCNLHYIRCFKPNGEQRADKFEGQMVLDQVVQCGTIELVKLMHDGYPNRCGFEEITTRFRDLLPAQFHRYGMRTFIEALMMAYEVPQKEWALGMSRLFLKAGQLKALEEMRTSGTMPSPEKLQEIVRAIIRKKWVRAVHAIRLCNYLPKFLLYIRQKKAQQKWRMVALFTKRFLPKVFAAKRRVHERHLAARRRLVGAVRAVQFAQVGYAAIRERRRERLAKAFRVAMLVQVRSRAWVASARRGARERALQRELERVRLEEERRRAEEEERRRVEEEERKAAEEQRRVEEERRREEERLAAEAEALRAEAERQRLEEEMERKRLEAEEQRRREEQKAREEAERLEAERLRIQLEAEARQRELEEQARHREEEFRKQMEEQLKQQKEEMMAQLRREQEEERQRFAEERKLMQEERLAFEEEKRRSVMIRTQASPQRTPGKVPTEEARRHSEGTADQASTTEDDVGDSISHYSVAGKQAEMEETIKKLQLEMERKHEELRNQMAFLEEQNRNLESELREEKQRVKTDRSPGAGASPSPSLLALDEHTGEHRLPHTPDRTPEHSAARRAAELRASRSGQRPSLLSMEGSAARTHKGKRHSIATEALMAQELAEHPAGPVGEAVVGAEGIGSQRKWWAEQRQFLLDDLYGSSPQHRPRQNAGGYSKQARNLNHAFDAEEGAGTPASSAGLGASRMKQPTDFEWTGKRFSHGVR